MDYQSFLEEQEDIKVKVLKELQQKIDELADGNISTTAEDNIDSSKPKRGLVKNRPVINSTLYFNYAIEYLNSGGSIIIDD